MSEATTYGGTVVALQNLDETAQVCEQDSQQCSRGMQDMTASQEVLDQALARFRLDGRTLAASKRLQEATAALQRLVADGAYTAREIVAATLVALESVGAHRRLAQAVQEHGEAADMQWYRGGR